jgi:hypothetical protein
MAHDPSESIRREIDEKLNAIIWWLRRNADAERDPKVRAAFIEAHNAALKIKEGKE